MIVHVEHIFMANLPTKSFLEHDIFGLPCLKIHMIRLSGVTLVRGM
jgi:hypothetical protein